MTNGTDRLALYLRRINSINLNCRMRLLRFNDYKYAQSAFRNQTEENKTQQNKNEQINK